MVDFQIFINNAFVDAKSGKKFPTINPSTGAAITQISEGDKVIYILTCKRQVN